MKSITRVVLAAVLLTLAFPVYVAGAQDGGEDVPIIAVYYLPAESGTLAQNDSGDYTLTLENVSPLVAWLISAPSIQVYSLSTEHVMTNWANAEGLTAQAAMDAEGLIISFELSAPQFDVNTNVLVFNASSVDVRAVTADKAVVPDTFGRANLSIQWTEDFQSGLALGIEARYEGMRAMPASCDQALTTWKTCRTNPTYRAANLENCMDAGTYLDVNCW